MKSRAIAITLLVLTGTCQARSQEMPWSSVGSAGIAAYQRWDLNEAEKLFEESAKEAEQFGSSDPRFAIALNNQAMCLFALGRYSEAESLFKQALAIDQRIPGAGRSEVANILNNLASVQEKLGKYSEATSLYGQALVMVRENAPSDQLTAATVQFNLAELFAERGKYKDAEKLYRSVIATRQALLGPHSEPLAAAISEMASLRYYQHKYREAEGLYRQAHSIWEHQLEPLTARQKSDFASSVANLGVLYFHAHQYDEAKTLFERALNMDEETLGPDDLRVGKRLSELASAEIAAGQYDEAEPLCLRAISLLEKYSPKPYLALVDALNIYGGLLDRTNRRPQAELLETRAMVYRAKFNETKADHAFLPLN